MDETLVVVADSVRARLFRLTRDRKLEEIEDLAAPEDRLKNQAFNADRAGRSFDSAGEGRHAMEKSESPLEHSAKVFAGRIADRLEHGRTTNEFEKLVVIAEPSMLGRLRANFTDLLSDLVVCTIDKELTRETPERIAGYLPRAL